MFVRVSDEADPDPVPPKETVVLDLAVTLPVDPAGSFVSGTGVEANGDVQVQIHVEGAVPVTAGFSSSTAWSATMSQTLGFGVNGSAWQEETSDPDGDRTEVWWQTPQTSFTVDPVGDQVWGNEWTPGAVSVSIGDSSWPAVADSGGNFHLDLSGIYDIVASDLVEVSDTGSLFKDHTVTALELTGVDPDADEVTGIAAQDSEVWVNIHGSGDPDVVAVADTSVTDGWEWVAGFATGLIDPETAGYAYQPDDDGDRTQIQWPPPPPEQSFVVDPGYGSVVDDFEDGVADGWFGHGVMTAVGVPVNPNGGMFVGQTNLNGTGDCNGQWSPFGRQTPDRFGYDFYVEGDTSHDSGLAVQLRSSDAESFMARISYHNGNLRWLDESTGVVYQPIMAANVDTWYRIELRNIDWVLGTYDIWVDGVEQYVGATFIDPVTYIDKIQVYGCPTYSDAVMSLDNIVLGTSQQSVQGHQWPATVVVTLTVQHPDGPDSWRPVFYTGFEASVDRPDWGPDQTGVDFVIPDGVEILPGDLVTLTGDVSGTSVEKSHVVTELALTAVDADANTVTGAAAADSDVWVNIHGSMAEDEMVTADGTGVWIAPFGDIGPDTAGYAYQPDDDGDQTQIQWPTQAPQYFFNVDPVSDQVWGHQWSGGDLEVSVFGTAGSESWTVPVSDGVPDGEEPGDFNLYLNDPTFMWDLVAGDVVTVSHLGVSETKRHTVTALELTGVDPDADEVTGLAAQDSEVWVNIHGSGDPDVVAVADTSVTDGWEWVAGFATGLIDPETAGYAYQPDDDGDATQIQWPPPPPEQSFVVDPGYGSVVDDFEDGVADGWFGHGVMTAVGVPVNPNGGMFVGQTNLNGTGDCNGQWSPFGRQTPDRFGYDFYVEGDTSHDSGLAVQLRSSDAESFMARISYHNGNLRWLDESTGVVYQPIMAANVDTWYRIELRNIDWVLGTYDIWVDGVEQYVGATFIDPVTYIDKIQVYGCPTYSDAVMSLDNIVLGTSQQSVQGHQWPATVVVTLTVQHPDGPDSWRPVFYTGFEASVDRPDWGPDQTGVDFVIPDGVEILPGDLVTLTGDVSGTSVEKSHVVTELALTAVDADANTVTGAAAADSDVWVNIHGSMAEDEMVTADGTGVWIAPFGDIGPDTAGYAYQPDDDGDQTQIQWPTQAPQYFFNVDPVSDQVWGHQWSGGDLEVSVFGTAGSESWTVPVSDGVPDGEEPGDFNLYLNDPTFMWDLVAGDVVTVSHLGVSETKRHTVTALELTGVDPDADEVTGLAAQDSEVWVNIHGSGDPDVVAVADTSVTDGWEWVAGFATGLIDPETAGYAYQPDDDGDATQIQWPPPPPEQSFVVDPGYGSVVDDFEDGVADGWFGHGVMTAVGVPVNPNGGMFVGQTNLNGTGDCNGQWSPFGRQTPDRFGYDFYVEGDTSHDSGLAVQLRSSDAESFMARISYHNGNLRWLDESTGVVYQPIMAANVDTWYRIELRNIDWVLGTYDIWVDGVEQYVGATFIDPVTYIDKIQVYGCPTYSDAVMSLDNIVLGTSQQSVQGHQWPATVVVTLTVQHPDGPDSWRPVFYTGFEASVDRPDWGPDQTGVDFVIPDGVEILPGDLVTLTGDVSGTSVEKSHVVTELALTAVDADANTVTGAAAADSDVWVNIHGSMAEDEMVTADGTGVWIAPFGDIGPDTAGYAYQPDDDGDQTQIQWPTQAPQYFFNVDPVSDQVWGHQWSGGDLEVSVFGTAGSESWTVPVSDGVPDGEEPGDFNLYLNDPTFMWDLVAGDVVTVSHLGVSETKRHTVTALELTGVDPDADEVTGLAAQDSEVWVNIHGSGDPDVVAVADTSVTDGWEWVAGFATGLIDPETAGYAYQPDDDGDTIPRSNGRQHRQCRQA